MPRITLLVLGCLFITIQLASAAITDPVKIDAGLISGTNTASDVRAFKGIPFAAPPIGAMRWRPPQPVANWTGVRKADESSPRCMQAVPGARGGNAPTVPVSEDCLYLNVWTGAKSASERRPVIVFTYGGGFTGGSGSEPRYDGEALAKKGVVFVTLNYRLGVFGFFAHPELTAESDHKASGNYGFMDFIAALKWVQKNITAFGGDPKNVTIMGESAGAFMVAGMVGSPEGKGLFHRAIAESGAWMGLDISHTAPRGPAEEMGKQMGSLADLRKKPADELMRMNRGPVQMIVDGWIIPEDLAVVFSQGRQNDVDLLVGSNQDEGTFFAGQRGGRGPANATQFIDQYKQRFGDQADSFFKLYPANSDAEANTSSLSRVRDEMAWHMRTWAKIQSKRGKGKAYWYYFTRVPPTASGQPSRGATHTAELAYVFNNLVPPTPWTDADRSLADTLSSYWTNFAANGDPNGKGLPVWPAFKEKTSERAMILGDKVEPSAVLEPARVALYDGAFQAALKK